MNGHQSFLLRQSHRLWKCLHSNLIPDFHSLPGWACKPFLVVHNLLVGISCHSLCPNTGFITKLSHSRAAGTCTPPTTKFPETESALNYQKFLRKHKCCGKLRNRGDLRSLLIQLCHNPQPHCHIGSSR